MAKFERYARLVIERGSIFGNYKPWKTYDFSSSYDSMNLKFTVECPAGSFEPNSATISVCGMTKDVVEELTMFMDIGTNQRKYVRAKLYAGYKDASDMTLIYAGEVTQTKPTQPPDVWLEMTCCAKLDMKHEFIAKYTSKTLKLKEIYQFGAQWMGLALDWRVKGEGNDISVEAFSYNNSVADFPAEMTKAYPAVESYVSMDCARLVCIDRDKPEYGGEAWIVSKDTIMCGVPEPSPRGVIVKVFMSVGIKKFEKIFLKSDVYPSAQGTYIINGFKHMGEIRGPEWVTELDCTKVVRFAG